MFRRSRTRDTQFTRRWRREGNRARGGAAVAVAAALLHCGGDATDARLWVQSESRVVAAAGHPADEAPGAFAGSLGAIHSAEISRADAPASGALSSYLWINEVKIDPPGTDGNYEFVELRGEPFASLLGHWLVTIEGDSDSNLGQVDTVIDLSTCDSGPCQLDERGLLLLVAEPAATVPATGAFFRTSSELGKGGLENGTTSLLLLAGPMARGADLDWDSDDNGELELPADLIIKDSVGWLDGNAGDANYALTVLGPKPKPQAIWHCDAGDGASEWRAGQLLGESASLAVDVAHSVPEGLDAVNLTPGASNLCQRLAVTATVPSALAGAGGTGGTEAMARPAAAGCGGTSRGAASSANGNTTLRSAGTIAVGGSSPTASVSVVATAPTGGRDTTTVRNHSGSASAGVLEAVAGCSPVQPFEIAAQRVVQAGNSGWWSPNPFAALLGGQPDRAATTIGSSTSSPASSGSAASAPELPGSCTLSRMSAPSPGLLWLLGVAVLGRCTGLKRKGRT